MVTLEKTIKAYLEQEPRARERRFRNRTVWNILQKLHRFETLDKDTFCKLYTKFDSVRRLICKVQEENENLRGQDYSPDKDILEQEKMLELGYQVRHYQDVKTLARI